jgi:single-strand DNA-binding protein
VGVVAWNKLAESCRDRLKKGSAVLVDGELQSRSWKTEEGHNRSIVEIKAKRIQFLNKIGRTTGNGENNVIESVEDDMDYEDNSFDKFLSDEESELLNNK